MTYRDLAFQAAVDGLQTADVFVDDAKGQLGNPGLVIAALARSRSANTAGRKVEAHTEMADAVSILRNGGVIVPGEVTEGLDRTAALLAALDITESPIRRVRN